MKATYMTTNEPPSSKEAELDRSIKILITKVVTRSASPQETSELQELMQKRQTLMRSPVLDRLEKLRRQRVAG
jgi:hypothetical protein